MELDPTEPVEAIVEVRTGNRRNGPKTHVWMLSTTHRSTSHTSRLLMQLAEHLLCVLRGTKGQPDVEAHLHTLLREYGQSCPCKRIRQMRAVHCVHMHVNQPHRLQVGPITHHLRALQPTVTIWDVTGGVGSRACALCAASLDTSVYYVSKCGHTFCIGCISRWGAQHTTCPACDNLLHFSQ